MSPVGDTKMRILVTASSFADAASALRIAERMTQNAVSSLGGLLVDDENTRTACALPNQRIISTSGAVLLTPSQAQLHTMMNAEARAFRQLLEQTAASSALEWSFDRKMGDLISTAMHAASGWDAVVFGYRSSNPTRGNVVAFAPQSQSDEGLLALSQALAKTLRTDLLTFHIGSASPPVSGNVDFVDLEFDTPKDAIATLDKSSACAVLIDVSRGPIQDPQHVRDLINASRCPVIVFGASSAVQKVEHMAHIPPAPRSEDTPPAK